MPDPSISDNVSADSITKNPAAEIRKQKRNQRKALPDHVQQQHSQALSENLRREQIYKRCKRIACYIANDGEIDPWLIIEHARFACKQVYLPILSPFHNSLYFAPYQADDRLVRNRFNIPEPQCHPSQWLTAQQLDLLLLPLVAFDDRGNRLGMGGGFYDRTLAYLRWRRHWKKPLLAGLAHEIQKTDALTTQSWDIPLDYILTEKQLYTSR